jgi:hypothetical protein
MIKHINFPKIGWRLKSLLPALLSALLLILLCCSCGKAEASQKTLRQQGMDLVNLMAQMAASEEYGTSRSFYQQLTNADISYISGASISQNIALFAPF